MSISSPPADDVRPERQQVLLAISRRALCPSDTEVLISDAATLLAETMEADFAAVGEVSDDGRSLRLRVLGAAIEPTPAAREPIFVSLGSAESLAAHCLEVAHAVVAEDLGQTPFRSDPMVRRFRARSAIVVPLKAPGQPFGTLGLFSLDARGFDERDLTLAETVGHLLTTAVARSRAEDRLAARQAFVADLLETLAAPVLTLGPDWRIRGINRAARRLTGFTSRELEGRPVFGTLIPLDDESAVRRLATRSTTDDPPSAETRLVTKCAERRQIVWSARATQGATTADVEIILTGSDVTVRHDSAAGAERSRKDRESEHPSRGVPVLDGPDSAKLGRDEPPASETDSQPAVAMPQPVPIERRRRVRRSYPYTQRVAPIVDGRLPKLGEFVEVLCHDIAAGGFSFFADGPPVSDALVVALGSPGNPTFLTAQVAHVTRLGHQPKARYLVGCTYTGRASY